MKPIGAATTRYSYLYDPHGSVSRVLDQSNNVKANYSYSAYGSPTTGLTKIASGFIPTTNPYRYTAKRFDTGSNTLDMGARRYSAGTGRFLQYDQYAGALDNLGLSLDPINANRYAFTGANPINYIEDDGHVSLPDDGPFRGRFCAGCNDEAPPKQPTTTSSPAPPKLPTSTGPKNPFGSNGVGNMTDRCPKPGIRSAGVFGISFSATCAPTKPTSILINTPLVGDIPGTGIVASSPAGGDGHGTDAKGGSSGGENDAAKRGRAEHEKFKNRVRNKPGWVAEPQNLIDPVTGKKVVPDALTPSGRPVDLKPDTPSGRAQGRTQLKKYERTTGKSGRVIYYPTA